MRTLYFSKHRRLSEFLRIGRNIFRSNPRHLLSMVTFAIAAMGSPCHASTGLQLGSGTAGPGETVTIPVQLQSDAPKVALQFDVRFDSSMLRPGTALAPVGVANRIALSSSPTPGFQRVIVYSSDGSALGNGTIANLTWYIPTDSTQSQSPLTLTNAVVSDRSAKPAIDTTISHGAITIRSETAPVFLQPVITGGQFVAQLSGQLGRQYRLQISSNLLSWEDSTQASPANGVVTFRDPIQSSRAQKFYRALLIP